MNTATTGQIVNFVDPEPARWSARKSLTFITLAAASLWGVGAFLFILIKQGA